METLHYRKRNTGYFNLAVVDASESLQKGGKVGIMSIKENDYAERIAKAIKAYSGINVEIKRTTRKEPQDNRKLIFDEMGEVIGVDISPQVDIFSGWLLSVKK